MKSFQQRVMVERNDLQVKLESLDRFIMTPMFDALGPPEQMRLQQQRVAMVKYLSVLNERIEQFPTD